MPPTPKEDRIASTIPPGRIDGQCDIAGNMVREVREETGLDVEVADQYPCAFGHQLAHAGGADAPGATGDQRHLAVDPAGAGC